MTTFFEKVDRNPIIAAVSNLDNLDIALDSPCEIIFLLTGNIFNLKEIATKVRSKNKDLYIHIESIDGFSKDTWGLEYIIKNIYPDGIITEKDNLIKLSKSMGVFTIQRFIVMDSNCLRDAIESIKRTRPNAIEILPGVMPKVIKKIIKDIKLPIISSGLISDKDDFKAVLDAGAIAISSSKKSIWNL